MMDPRDTTRREFLKRGAAGLAGAALLSGCSRTGQMPEPQFEKKLPSVRTLGRTGLELPVVSMGSIYGIELVQAALDQGIVHIHTSSGYSERNHERLMGGIFKDRPRDSFVIATSPDIPYRVARGKSRSLDVGTGIDPALITESIEGSLKRLNLDCVDIYYMVSVGTREVVEHEPYIRAYEKLKEQGKIRFAGIGTHANEPEVIRAAAGTGFWDVILTAYNFRQSHREEIRSALAEAADAGMGVVAMKTQAGVYWDMMRTRMINMKAALKWVLQDENVHTTIPAFSTFDELHEDLSVMDDLALTPEERRDLRLGPENAALTGNFCQQCGDCLAQCPAGIDVPLLMRGSMYAMGHGQPGKARATLHGWSPADVACSGCDRCEVRCSLGLDVRERTMEMSKRLEASAYS